MQENSIKVVDVRVEHNARRPSNVENSDAEPDRALPEWPTSGVAVDGARGRCTTQPPPACRAGRARRNCRPHADDARRHCGGPTRAGARAACAGHRNLVRARQQRRRRFRRGALAACAGQVRARDRAGDAARAPADAQHALASARAMPACRCRRRCPTGCRPISRSTRCSASAAARALDGRAGPMPSSRLNAGTRRCSPSTCPRVCTATPAPCSAHAVRAAHTLSLLT